MGLRDLGFKGLLEWIYKGYYEGCDKLSRRVYWGLVFSKRDLGFKGLGFRGLGFKGLGALGLRVT